jgi:hypothetical protein
LARVDGQAAILTAAATNGAAHERWPRWRWSGMLKVSLKMHLNCIFKEIYLE